MCAYDRPKLSYQWMIVIVAYFLWFKESDSVIVVVFVVVFN